eukprot:15460996-Alexandrium_andersonii.AAC.1
MVRARGTLASFSPIGNATMERRSRNMAMITVAILLRGGDADDGGAGGDDDNGHGDGDDANRDGRVNRTCKD